MSAQIGVEEMEHGSAEPSSQVSSLDLDVLEMEERRVSGVLRQDQQDSIVAASSTALRLKAALEARGQVSLQSNGNTSLRSTTYRDVKQSIVQLSGIDLSMSKEAETLLLSNAKHSCRAAFIAQGLDAKMREAAELVKQHMRRIEIRRSQLTQNRAQYMDTLKAIETKFNAHNESITKASTSIRESLDDELQALEREHSEHGRLRRALNGFI